MLPRGYRNNNPGNIRLGANWKGMRPTQTDPDFCQFRDPVDGLRALMRVILTYARKYKLCSVTQIITRWAPPNENNTGAYIDAVSRYLGVLPNEVIDVTKPAILIGLAQGIVVHELGRSLNGYPFWYETELYREAYRRLQITPA